MISSFLKFLDHTQRRDAVGRTPLDEWSARRRDLYLTTHNTHNRQTSIPSAGLEPTIPASERPQTHALSRAATEIGKDKLINQNLSKFIQCNVNWKTFAITAERYVEVTLTNNSHKTSSSKTDSSDKLGS